jgi:cell division protein FtsW
MSTAVRHVRRPTAPRAPAPARPATYVLLVATVVVLNVVGVVMVLSASSVVSLEERGSAWYYFQRHLIWTLLGVLAFAIAQRVDYRKWRTAIRPLLFVTAGALVLVLVPRIGVEAGSSRRWLGFGPVTFQPSELAKLVLILFVADLLTRREHQLHDWRHVLRPVLFVLAGFVGLVLMEPDLDSAALLGVLVGAVLLVGGVRVRDLGAVGAVGLTGAAVFTLSASYRMDRVMTFLDPSADPSNAGYQATQSLIHLGSGGIDGVGLGAGRGKWLFLPNAHTDFIFSVIGEEVGLIGTLLVLGLFVGFGIVGARTALHAPDRFGTLVAAGITFWVVLQGAVNMGGVVGLLPVSSVPLPFVSFGGSALVITMLGAGVLANIARRTS